MHAYLMHVKLISACIIEGGKITVYIQIVCTEFLYYKTLAIYLQTGCAGVLCS